MRLERKGKGNTSPPPRVCFFQAEKIRKKYLAGLQTLIKSQSPVVSSEVLLHLPSLLTARPPNLNPILRLLQNRQTC